MVDRIEALLSKLDNVKFSPEQVSLIEDRGFSVPKKQRAKAPPKPRKPRAKKVVMPIPPMTQQRVLPETPNIKIALTKAQINKIKLGRRFQIPHHAIHNPNDSVEGFTLTNLHPDNVEKLIKAKKNKKSARITLSESEIEGSGIKEFFQGVGRFFKNNWGTIKPIVSTVLDMGAPALAKAFPEASPAILAGRQLIKKTTGVGMDSLDTRLRNGGSFLAKGLIQAEPPRRRMCAGRLAKGSPEAKAHMAKLRAMRGKRKASTGGRISVMY
jgi:hypothetical protein